MSLTKPVYSSEMSREAEDDRIHYAGCSLAGQRDENQDALIVKTPSGAEERSFKGLVACIADGVSCSHQGQQASHTATTQFVTDYFATPVSWQVKHAVSELLNGINRWLYQQGQDQLYHNGMVTTFSAVIVKSNTAWLFHVGDSRIYLCRDGVLSQLTRDHQRVSFGQHRYLTRALGMDEHLEIDCRSLTLQPGDRLLLTTDGVHDFLSHEALQQLAGQAVSGVDVPGSSANPYEAACQAICQAALQSGSTDNTSCVLLNIDALPQRNLPEHQQRLINRKIPPALREGQRLDHFQIIRPLYEGTRSHVYLACDQTSGEKRVLKIPSRNYMDDPAMLKQFANESWIADQLDNVRIMKMYPCPEQSDFVYQVCEFIDGITLRQWMYDHPQPTLEKVREILSEVIKALRVLQRADMVHRDLKPENIMLTADNQVKLIDFGAVEVFGLRETQPEAFDDFPLGAVNYTAPEYIHTGQATIVSDLFSVGVIGYEMLAGQLPYQENSWQHVQRARHLRWQYRSLADCRPDLPAWVDAVFAKVTAESPASRYQVLGDFIVDLYTPDQRLLRAMKDKPLIERRPVLFWKSVALIAALIAIIEGLLLLSPPG